MPSPLPWKSIESHPGFVNLSDPDKDAVRNHYFDTQVVPHKSFQDLDDAGREQVRQHFFAPPVESAAHPGTPAAAASPPPERGFMGDLKTAVLRGVTGDTAATYMDALAGVDEFIDRFIPEDPGSFDLKQLANMSADQIKAWRDENLALSAQAGEDDLRGWVTQGVESATHSLAVRVPGTAVGAAAGSVLPGLGTTAGAVIGFLTGAPLFGVSQYNEALGEARKRGLKEDEAQAYAMKMGASETAFEFVSDGIELLTLGTSRALTTPGKAMLKKSLFNMLKGGWKQALKTGAGISFAEGAGEMMNVATQAQIARDHGLGTQAVWEAVRRQIGPVAVSSLIFGVVGGSLKLKQHHDIKKALQTAVPEAAPADRARQIAARRVQAAKAVKDAIAKTSPDLADQWAAAAYQAVLQNQPIDLTTPVDQFKATPQAPAAEAPLGSAGQEVTNQATPTADPLQDDATTLAQERAAALQEFGNKLSGGQQAYIKDLVKQGQGMDAIAQMFPDNSAAVRYAQILKGIDLATKEGQTVRRGTAKTDQEIRNEREAAYAELFPQAEQVDENARRAAKAERERHIINNFIEQLTGRPVKSAQESAQAILNAEEENKNAIARAQMDVDTMLTRRGDAAGAIHPDGSIATIAPQEQAPAGPVIPEGYLQQFGQSFADLINTVQASQKKEVNRKAVSALTRGTAKTSDELRAQRAQELEVAFTQLEEQEGAERVRQFVEGITGETVKSAKESAEAILQAERRQKYAANRARRSGKQTPTAAPAETVLVEAVPQTKKPNAAAALTGKKQKKAPRVTPGAYQVTEEAREGGVTRLIYKGANGVPVGEARLMGTTIGDVEVYKNHRRQGHGLAILQDLQGRGGLKAIAGSTAGAGLMEKAGMRKTSESGSYEFPAAQEQKKAADMTPDELLAEWDRQVQAKEKPTLTQKASEVKGHVKNAIDKFKAINELLGETGAIGQNVETDPKDYGAVRTLLREAFQEMAAAGKSGAEFVALALEHLSAKGRPYFEKFVREELGDAKEKASPYFKATPDAQVIDIGSVLPRQPDVDPEKKERAQRLMEAAKAGDGEKRNPVQIMRRADGKYVVLDGNTTTTIMRERGEHRLLAEVITNLKQPEKFDTIEKIYAQAEKDLPVLVDLTQTLAKRFNARALFRPEGQDLKDKARSRDKVQKKYGDARLLKDVIASTLSFKTEKELFAALEKIDAEYGVLQVKDRFKNPVTSGYRDVQLTVRLPSGLHVEIQLTQDYLFDAKMGPGHHLYQAYRELLQVYKEDTMKNAQAGAWADDLVRLSKQYYDGVYQRAATNPLANTIALPREISDELNRISAAIPASSISTRRSPSIRQSLREAVSYTKGTSSESKNLSAMGSPPVDEENITTKPTDIKGLVTGASAKLVLPKGKSQPVTYALAEADQVIASHDAMSFAKRSDYPAGVQERTYHSDKAEQFKVIDHAKHLKTNLVLTNNPDAINGPPIMTPAGVVLGGNSRAMTIQRAYAEDDQNGKGAKYKEKLTQFASQFGLSADQVNGFDNPVLVRVLTPGKTDTKTLHRLASAMNAPLTQSMSAEAKTASRGSNVSTQTLEKIGAILADRGLSLRELLAKKDGIELLDLLVGDDVLSVQETSQYVNSKFGLLNADGKKLVEDTIYGAIINDADLLATAPQSLLNKVAYVLTPLAKLKARGGRWDITPQVMAAVEMVTDLNAGGFKSVKEYLAQQSLFGEKKTDGPVVEAIAKALHESGPRQLMEKMKPLAAAASANIKKQTYLFKPPSFREAFKKAFGVDPGAVAGTTDNATVPSTEVKPKRVSPAAALTGKKPAAPKGLSEEQKKFIADKVRDLASLTAVERFYPGTSPVETFAKQLAQKIYGETQLKNEQKSDKIEPEGVSDEPTEAAALPGPVRDGGQTAPEETPADDVRGTEDRPAAGPVPGKRGDSQRPGDRAADGQRNDDTGSAEPGAAPVRVRTGGRRPARPGDGRRYSERHTYRITDADALEAGGKVAKFDRNVAAITLLKQIEAENRLATADEQKVLVQYVGWGGLPEAFRPDNMDAGWAKRHDQLKALLTEDEYEAAHSSIINAHYTTPEVIGGIYQALGRLGVSGDQRLKILEPGSGAGHFMGMLPEGWQAQFTGIEKDALTARLSQQLYQTHNIKHAPFEDVPLPDNHFDLVVGNVPFADVRPYDPAYKQYKFQLHDYFMAKSMDKLRPGGLMAVLTSAGTLDKKDKLLRQFMAERADFLGAVRLPGDTFKKLANTEVTADILFFRKRAANEDAGGADFVDVDQVGIAVEHKSSYSDHTWTSTEQFRINGYFKENPKQILGTLVPDKLHPDRIGVKGTAAGLGKRIDTALQRVLPENIYQAPQAPEATNAHNVDLVAAPDDVRELNIYAASSSPGGKVTWKFYQKVEGNGVPLQVPKAHVGRMRDLLSLRGTLRQHLRDQLAGNLEAFEENAQALNKAYDSFVRNHGALHAGVMNQRLFGLDPDFPALLALEQWDAQKKTASKTDIFTKPTVSGQPKTTVTTPEEALAASLFETGGVSWQRMADWLNDDVEALQTELYGKVFHDPAAGGWVTADAYLSGDVKSKLEAAQAAHQVAEDDTARERYAKNITALTQVIPEDIPAERIEARLGSPWVPAEDVAAFMDHLMDGKNTRVRYVPQTASWTADADQWDWEKARAWGTDRRKAIELIRHALNNTDPVVRDPGPKKGSTVMNPKETMLASAKIQEIQAEFARWLWDDAKRRERLGRIYNDRYNRIRQRVYDGSHQDVFPGMNPAVTLRDYQKNVVWRLKQGTNTLLDHGTGSGKTFSMITAAMEMKRLGLIRKPMFVVPKSIITQWEREFKLLYPAAKVLISDMSGAATNANVRRERLARIATGEWDAVLVTHDHFGMMPMSREAQADFMKEQIRELERALRMEKAERSPNRNVEKEIKKAKERLKAKLKALLDSKRDPGLTYEELGVDQLFVDEAHRFKNLFFSSRMGRIPGVGAGQDVKKTSDMYMKTTWMTRQNNGRGVAFATATPISNSISEMYTMMRYLAGDRLRQIGGRQFDAWANVFGQKVTDWEVTPTGSGFRQNTRFARFVNLQQLQQLYREFADVILKADVGAQLGEPTITGGKPQAVRVDASPQQKAFVQLLAKRMEAIRAGKVEPREDNALLVTGEGRKCALDYRLVSPGATPDPNRKTVRAADNIYRHYLESSEIRGTQMVFCDMSAPGKGFSVYQDLKNLLVHAGIPAEEIAFIHDAGSSDARRNAMFEKVNRGEIRVILGSTPKMGEGVNAQERIVAMHHLDAPWKPAEVEQRDGRGIRQGNTNDEVAVYRYVTQGTFDAYMWQTLELKAKFIDQVRRENVGDTLDGDIGAQTLSYAEVKALASDNPMILEKVQNDGALAVLEAQYGQWKSDRWRLEERLDPDRIDGYANQIQRQSERVDEMDQDLVTIRDNPMPQPQPDEKGKVSPEDKKDPPHQLTIGDGEYTHEHTRRSAVETALYRAAMRIAAHSTVKNPIVFTGEFRGVQYDIQPINFFQDKAGRLELVVGDSGLALEMKMPTEYASKESAARSYRQYFDRLEDTLADYLEKRKAHLAYLKKEQASAKKTLAEMGEFSKLDELKERRRRAAELKAELEKTDEQRAKEAETETPTETTPEESLRLATPEDLARVHGVTYDGFWEDVGRYMFTDPVTKSSITVAKPEDLPVRLAEVRELFGKESMALKRTPAKTDQVDVADVRQVFPGQHVNITPQGHIAVKSVAGPTFTIKTLKHITPRRAVLEADYGRSDAGGKMVAGRQKGLTLELRQGFGDRWILTHESIHGMEYAGILNGKDIRTIQAKIRSLYKKGQWTPTNNDPKLLAGKEDRAVYITDQLYQRAHKTPVGRIISKVRDWLFKAIELISLQRIRTARGVIADIESGAIHTKARKRQEESRHYIESARQMQGAYALNPDVDPDEEVAIVDLTGLVAPKIKAQNAKAFVKQWEGVELSLRRGKGRPAANGRLFRRDPDHAFWSSRATYRKDVSRRQALKALDRVLAGTVLVESVPDRIQPGGQLHRFYVPVRSGKTISVLRIVALQQGGQTAEVNAVEIYDVIKENPGKAFASGDGKLPQPATAGPRTAAGTPTQGTLTIREMLAGVKDIEGIPYFEAYQQVRANHLTTTPAFKAWFANSKVVDPDGQPLMVFHGSPDTFEAFDKEQAGRQHPMGSSRGPGIYFTANRSTAVKFAGPDGQVYTGYLSAQNPLMGSRQASEFEVKRILRMVGEVYTEMTGDTPSLYGTAWKDINTGHYQKNHLDVLINDLNDQLSPFITSEAFQRLGYDALNYASEKYDGARFNSGQPADTWVIFEPTQFKSVDNRGSWNPEDSRMSYRLVDAPQQPTGPEVAADLEASRTYANRIFEQRDMAVHQVDVTIQQLQKRVQALAGEKSRRRHSLGFAYDKDLKRSRDSDQLDAALMVWRDLQRNPDKATEFRTWAKDALVDKEIPRAQRLRIKDQLVLLDRAEALTDAQKALADEIGAQFESAYQVARANKVIQSHQDHYVRRIWDFQEKTRPTVTGSGSGSGFRVTTTAAKPRTLDTILDGWMAGYDLGVKGLTNAYGHYLKELETIIANKDFITQSYHTIDRDGRRLFATSNRGAYAGYVPLNHPAFKVWEWAGSVTAESGPDIEQRLLVDDRGRHFFYAPAKERQEAWWVFENEQAEKPVKRFYSEKAARRYAKKQALTRIEHKPPRSVADAWEERRLYAPPEVARVINKMTAQDKLFSDSPLMNGLARWNAGMKSWVLLSSFFHHLAGARSWAFGVSHGLRSKTVTDPTTGELIKVAGMNPVKAYKMGLKKIEDRAPLIQIGVKNGLTLGDIQDWSETLLRERRGFSEMLANKLGLEKVSGIMAAGRFKREQFTDALFKRFFAGLKAEAFATEFVHQLQLEKDKANGQPVNPDRVAEKVARLINADFGGLHLERMGRNPTLQKMARLLLLAPDWTESNFRTVSGMIPGLNRLIGKAVGDLQPPPGMEDVYRRFWGRVALRIAVSTIMVQLLLNGLDDSEDFWKDQALSNRWNKYRWTEVDITKIYEVLGIDTGGNRKTFSIGGHFFDPLKLFDPFRLIKHKASPAVRVGEALFSGTNWREQPFTGAKELLTTGKTVKKSPHEPKESGLDRLPSAVVNQVTNLQPVQVGYFLRYLQGEDDGLSALLQSGGLGVHTAWEPRSDMPIDLPSGSPTAPWLQQLKDSGALKLGQPTNRIMVGGSPIKLSPAEYQAYQADASDRARRKLDELADSDRVARMTPQKQAALVEKVIKSARKKARASLKRRLFDAKRTAKETS